MGIEEIKLHDWFKNVDWNAVRAKTVESPLRKGLRFRRESLDDSQLSARAKKRRQEQRKAMAAVEEDLKADKRYVASLGSSVSIANRPKAPMEKWRGGILAGYCFRSLKPFETFVPEAPTPPSPSPVLKEISEESASESKAEEAGSEFMSCSTSAVAPMTTTSNADSEKDVTETDPSSEGSEESSPPASMENESNNVPVIPIKTTPPVNPVAVKGSSSSMPPTPAIASWLSPAKSVSRGASASSAPVTPSTKSFHLPPSSHFPHLQALLTSSSDEKLEHEENSAKAANVPAGTTVDARNEDDSVGSKSFHVEEVGHVTYVHDEIAAASDRLHENDSLNHIFNTLEQGGGDGREKKTSDIEQPEIRMKEVLVEDPQSEEGSETFPVASEDFTEANVRTNDTTDEDSIARGEDGITSVGVHEIREALGFPSSKQDERESQTTENHSVEDRSTPIVAEKMKSANEIGHEWVEDTEQDKSSKLPRKSDSVAYESSSPPSDPNTTNSTVENNVDEKGFAFQTRPVNKSQLCDVSSLVTDMYIPNPFVPSPTSVQDVAVARNVAG
ncbi:hypothetical protein FGB62_1g112 [Gracilaria domingensis]|nr:hypothetical protein FGB62_1g112 [Gracilaria domingensis]